MAKIETYTEKTAIAQDDLFIIADSASANATKKVKAKNVTPFRFAKFHLKSAQIQTGNSIPIVLVPAAGAGTAIYAWHDTTARCINGAVPATATVFSITEGGRDHIAWNNLFLGSSTNNPIKGDDSVGINRDDCIIENTDLIATFDADNPAYDGTIDIYLKYEIITL